MLRITKLLVTSALLMMLAGCSSSDNPASTDGGGNGNTDPSFATNIQPIFNSSCALSGCHNSTAEGGLVLLSGQARANLVGINSTGKAGAVRVVPDNATGSYLVQKLEGTAGIVGNRMPPPPRGTLSEAEIELIRNWIEQGAKDN